MKKIALVSGFAVALLLGTLLSRTCNAQQAWQPPPPPPFDPAKTSVALLGDSITHGGLWALYFPAHNIFNHGVPGDGTEGMLTRLGPVLATKPQRILLLAGINDILRGRDPHDVFATYRQLVNGLAGGGRKLYVESTLYVTAPMPLAVNDKVNTLNGLLQKLCDDSRYCTYVDLNATLAPAGQLRADFTADGLHLNQAGYEAWFALLKTRKVLD
jgi:hypothetical protein